MPFCQTSTLHNIHTFLHVFSCYVRNEEATNWLYQASAIVVDIYYLLNINFNVNYNFNIFCNFNLYYNFNIYCNLVFSNAIVITRYVCDSERFLMTRVLRVLRQRWPPLPHLRRPDHPFYGNLHVHALEINHAEWSVFI